MDSPRSNLIPNWLKELQQKSWEPEILLSGIVLYGMFQVPEVLDRFLFFFNNEIYDGINAMGMLVALLKVGVYWLIVGLILHLICRGLWIGLVGLSYSFPSGINTVKLKFQPKYLKKVEAVPPFEAIILRLEHVCSFIYSISFLLFMSLLGTYIYSVVLIVVPFLVIFIVIDLPIVSFNRYSNFIMLFGLIGVFDFVTMGYLRRYKTFGRIYWPTYQLFNYLTLAKYYRPTYYAIATNLNKWWLFTFYLVFIFISYIGIFAVRSSDPKESFSMIEIWSRRDGNQADEGYYQDKKSYRPSVRVQIPSDIIRDQVLRVFLPANIDRQDSLKKFMNFDTLTDSTDEAFEEGKYYLEKISEFYSLTIADSTFKTKMYFQNVASTSQRGYITYLNIGFLEEGLYELKVEGPKEMYENPFAIVPFYKLD